MSIAVGHRPVTGDFPSQLRPDLGYGLMVDRAFLADPAVGPFRPLGIAKQGFDGSPLVGLGSPQSMRSVRSRGEEKRVTLTTFSNVRRDGLAVDPPSSLRVRYR